MVVAAESAKDGADGDDSVSVVDGGDGSSTDGDPVVVAVVEGAEALVVSGSVGTTAADGGSVGSAVITPPFTSGWNVLPARSAAIAANHIAVYNVADNPAVRCDACVYEPCC